MKSENLDNPPDPDSRPLRASAGAIVRELLDNDSLSDVDIIPDGELSRRIERFYGQRGTEPRFTDSPTRRSMTSQPDPDSPRRLPPPNVESSPLFVLPPPSTNPPPAEPSPRERIGARLSSMTARRGRPRITASDRYMDRHRIVAEAERHRALQSPGTLSGNGLADLQHAGRQLEAASSNLRETASSNLRALLDDPIPSLSSPTLSAQEYSGEAEHNRRAKRRKLDDKDKADTISYTGFSYGKYGQVEPGKLKMEIVSCDGGMYEEPLGGNYRAENILQNDATVYCTKSNRCNLVLRHQGGTVFCLKELIIKAPHTGYTAP